MPNLFAEERRLIMDCAISLRIREFGTQDLDGHDIGFGRPIK